MKKLILYISFVLISQLGYAQGNNCSTAQALLDQPSELNYCSADTAYTTTGSSNGTVWFKFVANRSNINITVVGHGDNPNATLLSPTISLYTNCNGGTVAATATTVVNNGNLYTGGLDIGQTYYFSVSGTNTGTFRLCINNYTPILSVGQDCSTAAFLCNTQTFSQIEMQGFGNIRESFGACTSGDGLESNSEWYKWTAANNGTLTFLLTPSANDDIDWALFDLGTSGDCTSSALSAKSIRCSIFGGPQCNPPKLQTGLSITSTSLAEPTGNCVPGEDGFTEFITVQQNHVYALMVNNFSGTNHTFTLSFGGTATFLGPVAKINFSQSIPNTSIYTFQSLSSNYTNLKWTFGDGASMSTATSPGPFNIIYNTPGTKTVVLEAKNSSGCSTVDYVTFTIGEITPTKAPEVAIKPANLFTPNGDGIHDQWEINGIANYPGCIIKIFNRWGYQVYSSIGYSTPWDGTFQGLFGNADLPAGTYYYEIDLKNGYQPIEGYVAIIR